ncbi:MAG TPA: sugar ABC transporter permease [Microlunatus sp.]
MDNFREVATAPLFWNSLKNTLFYTLALVAIVVPSSLIMALILNMKKLGGRTAYRVVFVLPVVLTSAVVGLEMVQIFATEGGAVNNLLNALGITSHNIAWLNIGSTAIIIVIVVGAWKSFGTKMIYWLAGLQTISRDVYEAAEVDGAGAFKKLIYITLPILLPFLAVITYLQVLDGLHVFDLVKTMTGGGPSYATDMTSLYIYRYAFEPSSLGDSFALPRFGFASAAGIFYGLTTFIITAVFAGAIGYSRSRVSKAVGRDEK